MAEPRSAQEALESRNGFARPPFSVRSSATLARRAAARLGWGPRRHPMASMRRDPVYGYPPFAHPCCRQCWRRAGATVCNRPFRLSTGQGRRLSAAVQS